MSYSVTSYVQRRRQSSHRDGRYTMNDPLLDSTLNGMGSPNGTGGTDGGGRDGGGSGGSGSENHDFHWLDSFRLLPKRDGIELAANLDLYFTVRDFVLCKMKSFDI